MLSDDLDAASFNVLVTMATAKAFVIDPWLLVASVDNGNDAGGTGASAGVVGLNPCEEEFDVSTAFTP